ncbi:chorismate mutase [Bacillus xiapuensis]|uniref:chorismate mutase n=1 Tax=Bacillus xiapuensis TaxID=2014075 RepID=UPI000C23F373|nr:chorismate mutase [Bacillus xiapuensis]
MVRGIRGAITVERNEEDAIVLAAEKLLREMIRLNQVAPENVCSVFISVTDDLNAAFPAKALRRFDGWDYVPVMCMNEVPVPGSLQKCIRVMLHVNTEALQTDIQHIYLEKAVCLRPDLHKQDHSVR